MTSGVLLHEVGDRVATTTLNRPGDRDALSADLRAELPRAVRRADADDSVDVVILTGADPALCAGLDLQEVGSGQLDLAAEPDSAAPGPAVRAGVRPAPGSGPRRADR